MGVPQMAPFNYAGTFTYDDTVVPNAGVPYPPKWKYFKANPPLDYSTNDTRKIGCWESSPGGVPVAGCDHDLHQHRLARAVGLYFQGRHFHLDDARQQRANG